MSELLFIEELKKIGVNLDEISQKKLKQYSEFLLQYNEHTNLTSIKDINSVYLEHFYDSLTLSKSIKFENQKILDIGSGAGFPGIVLKIVYPNINLTLLDSNNKKTKFLTELVKVLDISDVNIVNLRAEEFVKFERESFDLVTSRAVSNLRIVSELSLPFLKNGGIFLAMKANACKEIEESKIIILKLNSKIIDIKKFNLPVTNATRTIISIQKNKNIDLKYPRSYSKILKFPIMK